MIGTIEDMVAIVETTGMGETTGTSVAMQATDMVLVAETIDPKTEGDDMSRDTTTMRMINGVEICPNYPTKVSLSGELELGIPLR
jgi:hypothetical protein